MKPLARQAPVAVLLLRVFAPFTTVYMLSEMLRNVGGVAAPALRESLSLSAGELGLLSGVFMVAIAVLQVPVGIMLDRFGSRRVVSLFLLLAAAGTVLFTAHSYVLVLLGRMLTGAGLAACWVGAYKANALWWSPQRATLVNGALLGISGIGALAATLPTAIALDYMSWRTLFRGIACVIAVMAVLVWWLVPDHPDECAHDDEPASAQPRLSAVFAEPLFWKVAPVVLLCEGVWMGYQGLWAGVWLRQVNDMGDTLAATHLMWLAVAVIVGQLGLGAFADQLTRRSLRLDHVMAAIVAVFVAAQAGIVFAPAWLVGPLWVVFGLATAGSVMAYARIAQVLPGRLMGRAIALLNMCGAGAAFAIQNGVGWFVGLWPAGADGTPPDTAYQLALGGLVCAQLIALVWMVVPVRRGLPAVVVEGS